MDAGRRYLFLILARTDGTSATILTGIQGEVAILIQSQTDANAADIGRSTDLYII
jgi:hypothetical protein